MENHEHIDKRTEKGIRIKVDLDMILVEELGQFGWYQFRMMLLAFIIAVFGAWAATEFVFTTARIGSRCLIPECESASNPAEYAPPWILNAVPSTSGSSDFDNCQRFANATNDDGSDIPVDDGTCPADIFDSENIVECEAYVYENQESVVYDLDLGCDDWSRSFIGTIRTMGVFLTMPLTGFISDRWGRRTALVFNAFNTAWLGVIRYWTNTYAGFAASQFLEAVFGAGGFTCTYILVMELVGSKYRVAVGATMNTYFAIGQVTMGLIAWAVPNWRHLTLTLYIPQFLTISYLWIMSESVRWYMSKGRYGDSERVLKKVAEVNGKILSEKSLQALRDNAEEEKRKRASEAEQKNSEPWLIVLVFQHKRVLLRCVVSPVWWITTTFIYYGLSINSINMSGNKYLNYVAVSAVEIPGFWTSFALMGVFGRKPVLIGAFWICAACQFGYIFLSDGMAWLTLTLYLIGKFAIAMVMTALYVYTSELYPTKYRNRLFSFSSMMGRVGAMLAPLTPALGVATWDQLPFILFAAFALLSGLLVLITPETLGTKFPDTMEEASEIGRRKIEPL